VRIAGVALIEMASILRILNIKLARILIHVILQGNVMQMVLTTATIDKEDR
jgi:hypothetical protein